MDFDGGHLTVNHIQGEYTKGLASTNTAESFFGLLKRGVYGTFHHVSKEHLHRYCNEFSFRWNGREMSDSERREQAIRQMKASGLCIASQQPERGMGQSADWLGLARISVRDVAEPGQPPPKAPSHKGSLGNIVFDSRHS
jgi:hypothetical protein